MHPPSGGCGDNFQGSDVQATPQLDNCAVLFLDSLSSSQSGGEILDL